MNNSTCDFLSVKGGLAAQCPHRVYSDKRCIFHVPKGELNDQLEVEAAWLSEKRIQGFTNSLDQLVMQWRNDGSALSWELVGFDFPVAAAFNKTDFLVRPDFSEAIFRRGLYSDNCVFRVGADFSWSRSAGALSFRKCEVHSTMDFSGVRASQLIVSDLLPGSEASLTLEDGQFQDVEIRGSSIRELRGEKVAVKRAMTFVGEAKRRLDLSRSDIGSLTINAGCDSDVILLQARLGGDADVTVYTSGALSAERATVAGTLKIKYFKQPLKSSGPPEATNPHGDLQLHGLVFSGSSQLILDDTDLVHVGFIGTNLERVQFRNCIWPTTGVLLRRKCLGDEFRQKHLGGAYLQGPWLEGLAENYRQLVVNRERVRDFLLAEDFHVGEMETRRLQCGSIGDLRGRVRQWVNGYALYRALSLYGTSYWQSFWILMLFVAVFAGGFMLFGFNPSLEYSRGAHSEQHALRVVEYDLLPSATHQSVGTRELFIDARKAVMFVFSILTFQRDRYFEPVNDAGRLWLFLAIVVLSAQAALTLLAIRRRFRR